MFAAMAQQVEHVLGKDEVTGSNPVSSSSKLSAFFLVKSVGFFISRKQQSKKISVHIRLTLYLLFVIIK